MPNFTVKTGTLRHAGKSYAAGDVVELTKEQAAELPPGIVEPAPGRQAPAQQGK